MYVCVFIFLIIKVCDGTVYLNCEDVAKRVTVSGTLSTFAIDPTGATTAGTVTCMASGIHQVDTIVHHDSETRTHINGYEGYGEYAKSPVYSLTENQFTALRAQSVCKQHLKFECLNMAKGEQWLIMQGGVRKNYDDISYNGYPPCTCIFKETCDTGATSCICNQNPVWSQDEGYLTEQNDVPVMTLKYGDTGDVSEEGYHTLGPLICTHTIAPDLIMNSQDVNWVDRSRLIDGDNTTCVTLTSWVRATSRVYLMYEKSAVSVSVSIVGTGIPTEDGTQKTPSKQGILVYVDKTGAAPGYLGHFTTCSRIAMTTGELTTLDYICHCPYGVCEAVMIHMFSNQPHTTSICDINVQPI